MIFFRISCGFFQAWSWFYFYNNRSSKNACQQWLEFNDDRGSIWTFLGLVIFRRKSRIFRINWRINYFIFEFIQFYSLHREKIANENSSCWIRNIRSKCSILSIKKIYVDLFEKEDHFGGHSYTLDIHD